MTAAAPAPAPLIRSPIPRQMLLVAAYNTAIALFLSAVTPYDFRVNLLYSHCIGFGMYGAMRLACRLRGRAHIGWAEAAIGLPLGFAAGFVLATWLNGFTLAQVQAAYPRAVLVAAAAALVFGILGAWHFHDEARLAEAKAEARAERARRLEQEALAARAELALLQARIEPHFLFNTLSNVVGLIDARPEAAKTMLLDLTALLRASLARSRRPEVPLAEELELLRAYLGIMAVRMGDRLAWRIEADDDALAVRLPPLLVQPLVENAIRHGLEPKPGGGSLAIRCRREGDAAIVEVADSGLGLAAATATATAGGGLGLANVRERLAALYGDRAGLELTDNPSGGATARLRLPLSLNAAVAL